MEHYFKGENVEHEEVVDEELRKVLPSDHTWIKVKPGSKINNLIGPASAALKGNGIVLISGSGPALTKVVSCAEVVKRRCKASYQTTKLCSRLVEEHWEPTRDDLEPLKVTREIPSLQIALSKEPFETAQRQNRNSLETFLNFTTNKNVSSARPRGNKNNSKGSNQDKKSSQSAAKELGLENKKPKKNKNRGGGNKNGKEGSKKEQPGGENAQKPKSTNDSDIRKASDKERPSEGSKSPQSPSAASAVEKPSDKVKQSEGSKSIQSPKAV